MVPSRVLLMMASSEDSTMAARWAIASSGSQFEDRLWKHEPISVSRRRRGT